MLVSHSGGKVSKALEMAIVNGEINDGKEKMGESKIIGQPIKEGVDDELPVEEKGFCICC